MFVDKEATLPRSHKVSTGSGKIGAVGKVGIIQALHQKNGKGRKKFSKSSDRKTRAHTLTYLERDAASKDRKRDVE